MRLHVPATGLAGDNSPAAFGYVLTLCKILDRGRKTLQLPPNGFLHCTCLLSGVKRTRPFAGVRFCGRYRE
jgi:hypothetical protein